MKSIGNYGIGGSNIILRNRQLNFVNLVATITDTRVHEDTLILVYYSEATQAAAQAAGITTETNEGNITFTAANPPSSTIVCDVVLLSANMVSQMASASDIDYSNAQSGLTATDVQGAVDEVNSSKMKYDTPHFTDVMSSDVFSTTSQDQFAKQVLNVNDNNLYIGNCISCENIVFHTKNTGGMAYGITLNNIVRVIPDRVGPINVGTASETRYNCYSRANSMKPPGMKVSAGIYCGAWPGQTWSAHCILAEIINDVENSAIILALQSIGQKQDYYISMIYIYTPA